MTESLDAELLKFDRNDAEYQDFRFSFRIHMSLVSAVSHTLMDKCEIERAESDLPDCSESAGRCTPEMLLAGLDNERQCPNPSPIC